MAIVEVKVPQLSESVAEATLLQWKKHPGEAVEMDAPSWTICLSAPSLAPQMLLTFLITLIGIFLPPPPIFLSLPG